MTYKDRAFLLINSTLNKHISVEQFIDTFIELSSRYPKDESYKTLLRILKAREFLTLTYEDIYGLLKEALYDED